MRSSPASATRTLTCAFLLLPAAAAQACTVCDSPAGRTLRAGILDRHFLGTLAGVLSPLPLFLLAALLAPITLERFCQSPANRTGKDIP